MSAAAMSKAPSSVLWKDTPTGKCWACRVCDHRTMSGKLAGEHSMSTNHGLPQQVLCDPEDFMVPTPKTSMLAVRAGDYVQAGYDLRLALEIATVAISEAERAGSPASTVNKLRAMVKQLRG